jgi:hypothetical protein
VFGDFWVALQIPWDGPAETKASISASSALGLEIVRCLAATKPASERGGLAAFGNTLMNALQQFSADLPELSPASILAKPDQLPDDQLISRIKTVVHEETLRSRVVSRLIRGLGLQSVERAIFDALIRLVRNVEDQGDKLLSFLNQTVPDGAKVVVTGHSKGGALSTVTALWLAEQWAPQKKVEVQCFSFAGPTAGNTAFVERYNQRLGNRTRRIVNPLDVVPQAFVPERLRTLTTHYPKLKFAVDAVIESVHDLNYAHVGPDPVEIKSKPTTSNLVADLAYQHLDAYLKAAEFQSKDWNALKIFTEA